MLFLLKLPYIARSERTTKSKSRSNLFYSPLFLTKKQCDHENHNHIRRSTYEGHQYVYWLKSSSFETQVARNNIYIALSLTCLTADKSLTADPGVGSLIPARSHTFVEIDFVEIVSTPILLPSADQRRVVVS